MASTNFTQALDPKHLKSGERIAEGTPLPNTVEPIGDRSYEGQVEYEDDRFALTPLYTIYHEHALPEEYMIDRHTGAGAIMREDGSIISIEEMGRLNYHLNRIHDALSFLGMPTLSIYEILPDNDCEVMLYDNDELLDGPVTIPLEGAVERGVFSLDITVMARQENCTMMKQVGIDPETVITYRVDGTKDDLTVKCKASGLMHLPIDFNTSELEIVSIKFPEFILDDGRELYVHSICVAC